MNNDASPPPPPILGYAGLIAPPFKSFGELARSAKWCLIFYVSVQLIAWGIFPIVKPVVSPAISQLSRAWQDLIFALGVISLVVVAESSQIAAITLTCMWMYRAHQNTLSLGIRRPRFPSGWAVGSFFVPFVNLVVPYQAMQDIYDCSAPQPGSGKRLVLSWWLLWIFGNIISSIGGRISEQAGLSLAGTAMSVLGLLMTIVAAVLLIKIIDAIVERQSATVSGMTTSV